MRRRSTQNRGSALLTSVIFVGIIMVVTSGLLYYSSYSQRRAIQTSRAEYESSCAESGMQIAYSYFADPSRSRNWNTYLADPQHYNPVYGAYNTTPALGGTPSAATLNWATLKGSNPDLFYDLDGDGKEDVYIFIRDNADEIGAQNYNIDIDSTVYVGAVCISTTLSPRTPDGIAMNNTRPAMVEGLVSLKSDNCGYRQHGSCLGNGNQNSQDW